VQIVAFNGKKDDLNDFLDELSKFKSITNKLTFIHQDESGVWYKAKALSKKDILTIIKIAIKHKINALKVFIHTGKVITTPLDFRKKKKRVIPVEEPKLTRGLIRDPKFQLYEQIPGINILDTPLEDARKYVEEEFTKNNLDIGKELPNFNQNYLLWQSKIKRHSIGVPRSEMPVIEPVDVEDFRRRLATGRIDIFKPFTFGKFLPPEYKVGTKHEGWLVLGQLDGKPTDDVVYGKIINIPVKKLKPLQDQIWLREVVNSMLKFGVPNQGSKVTKMTIIISKDMYILDGHHRVTQMVLANPNLKIEALYIPLNIDTLLKIGKGYSEAIGRVPYA